MPDQDGRPQLIYILGTGHSGSTLLDRIVSSAPEVFGLGELFYFDRYRGIAPAPPTLRRVCTCGADFERCPFWSQVPVRSRGNVLKPESAAAGIRILLNLFNPGEKNCGIAAPRGPNGWMLAHIARLAKRCKPGLAYLLDSSKDPRRLYELIHDPEVGPQRLKVIHLVRDGRGYIWSFQKPSKRRGGYRIQTTGRSLVEWIVINAAARRMIARYGLPALHVSYDRFCRDLPAHLAAIEAFLGVRLPVEGLLERVNRTPCHNIHGSLSRFYPIRRIAPDDTWQRGLPAGKRRLVSWVLAPFHRRWVESSPRVLRSLRRVENSEFAK